MKPDMTKVDSLAATKVELKEYEAEVQEMADRAIRYVRSFPWCLSNLETFVGILIPGVVGVFLHHIIPARPNVDTWVWSVIGDLPSAYISVDDALNPAAALDGYIGAMKSWTEAVRLGLPLDDLIPVNAPPKREFADMLDSRLDYLTNMLEAEYSDDLES